MSQSNNDIDIEPDEYHDIIDDTEIHQVEEEPELESKPDLDHQPSSITEKENEGEVGKEEDDSKVINYESSEYKKYKKQLLGTLEPDKQDSKCNFYLMTNLEQVKHFIKNIKSFDYNFKLDESHITNIIKQIKNDHDIYFTNPIALVEYTDYDTCDARNLFEIIDGHHRIASLKKILVDSCVYPVEIWMQVYKRNTPNSSETKKLFKKYNNTKPFPVNRNLIDFKYNLVNKINEKFKNSKGEVFELIRDSNKPRIRKDEFNEAVEKRIDKQNEISDKDIATVDIDTLVQRFLNYNNVIITKPYEWFTNKKAEHYCGKHISRDTFDNNKAKYKCLLAYVKLEYLISQCIYI